MSALSIPYAEDDVEDLKTKFTGFFNECRIPPILEIVKVGACNVLNISFEGNFGDNYVAQQQIESFLQIFGVNIEEEMRF